jgi:restriction endonuclease S subunit
MQPLLSDLADIRIGLTMRGPDASRRTDNEGLHLLRISDISEDGQIEISSPHLLDRSLGDDSRYRVTRNDILIANRGTRMTAALVPEGLDAIASGQLFIVKPQSDRITPEFLHWFLNLATTQDRLRAQSCGSYVKTLPVTALRELPIPVIPLELQTKLCALADLARRERELLRLLAEKRGILLQYSFTHILTRFTT